MNERNVRASLIGATLICAVVVIVAQRAIGQEHDGCQYVTCEIGKRCIATDGMVMATPRSSQAMDGGIMPAISLHRTCVPWSDIVPNHRDREDCVYYQCVDMNRVLRNGPDYLQGPSDAAGGTIPGHPLVTATAFIGGLVVSNEITQEVYERTKDILNDSGEWWGDAIFEWRHPEPLPPPEAE